jgi:hypothetical protein
VEFRGLFDKLLGRPASPQSTPLRIVGDPIEALNLRALLAIYDPILPAEGGRKLSQVMGWNQVDRLVAQFIEDLKYASFGICNYHIVERIEVDALPVKIDGYSYSRQDYLDAWRSGRGFHIPDWADYHRILSDFNIVARIEGDQIDEVWLFAFPYGGFYESRMVGPGAFWCNSPPLEGYEHFPRRFTMMGFNYERGVGEMLESYGHRAESIMSHVYRRRRGEANLWQRFIRYDKSHPGRAEVGNVHYAPNSQQDYDWGNRSRVPSRCDTWYRFPDLSGSPRLVSCYEWGNGDTRQHHLWWFRHFPHVSGETDGISNNWWEYVADPNLVQV